VSDHEARNRSGAQGTAREVLREFTVLGLTSFGGPIAHLGYFRERLVVRRRWISEQGYAELVALAQFLPGPASSQVGFALGLHRAGVFGGFVAFAAFTLPSVVLIVLVALAAPLLGGPIGDGLVAGLKVVAVAVVAHAVWGMARTLTPDLRRAGIAVGTGGLVFVLAWLGGGVWAPVASIVLGALAGLLLCRAAGRDSAIHGEAASTGGTASTGGAASVGGEATELRIPISRRAGGACLVLVAALLLVLPVLAALAPSMPLAVLDAFWRAGSLVFGGGHVVLPLLETAVVGPGWVSESQFLAGYGAAQAVPGPLFTFAAYLGTLIAPGVEGLLLAVIALAGIFAPGLLLMVGVLPFWATLRRKPLVTAAVRGASAAVVGVLAAALIDPVITSAVIDVSTAALAALSTVLLIVARVPAWAIVVVGAIGGVLLAVF